MFELQHDSGDEHHAHDQASRERDSIGASHFFQAVRQREDAFDDGAPPITTPLPPRELYRHMTNTPRNGETPKQVAARFRVELPPSAKDCVTYCHDACDCGLRAAGEEPKRDAADALAALASLREGFKENNPKDAFGVLKACMSWVPLPVIMELCLAMAEGGFKYGGHNYMVAAPRASVYTDGAFRHIYQFTYEGDLDHESKVGLHHISKAIASLVVLRAAQINDHWVDDRPPQAPEGFLADCNAKMVELAQAFPEPVARYLKDGKRGPGRIIES